MKILATNTWDLMAINLAEYTNNKRHTGCACGVSVKAYLHTRLSERVLQLVLLA